MDDQGWERYQLHVLKELKRIGDEVSHVHAEIHTMMTEISMLKLKSGIWGALAGAIPVVIYLALESLRNA